MGLHINMKNVADGAVVHVDTNTAAVKTGIAGGGAVATYLTLNEWVAIATLIFVTLQIGLLIPKYWQLYKNWKEGKRIRVDK